MIINENIHARFGIRFARVVSDAKVGGSLLGSMTHQHVTQGEQYDWIDRGMIVAVDRLRPGAHEGSRNHEDYIGNFENRVDERGRIIAPKGRQS